MQQNRTIHKPIGCVWFLRAGGTFLVRGLRPADPIPAASRPPGSGYRDVQPQKVVLTTELPGRTAAYLVAEIRPQVNGLIQKRLFVEGADVKAGQVLYQIDPAPFQAALTMRRQTSPSAKVGRPGAGRTEASIAHVTQQRAILALARTNRSGSRMRSRTAPSPPASATRP